MSVSVSQCTQCRNLSAIRTQPERNHAREKAYSKILLLVIFNPRYYFFFSPQILVVLTDGASTGGEKSLRVPLKNLEQSYVNIFAIGIGRNINKRELEMMATPPVKEHVFYVATMQQLQTLLTNIGESACMSKCIPGVLPYLSNGVLPYIGMIFSRLGHK